MASLELSCAAPFEKQVFILIKLNPWNTTVHDITSSTRNKPNRSHGEPAPRFRRTVPQTHAAKKTASLD